MYELFISHWILFAWGFSRYNLAAFSVFDVVENPRFQYETAATS